MSKVQVAFTGMEATAILLRHAAAEGLLPAGWDKVGAAMVCTRGKQADQDMTLTLTVSEGK